ncbi:alkaline phosphatase PafA [Salinimicrobium xinjiangense]|uniref:alkaline phosphatase PafA n=1 Tax=Salinimicrobium xinjiangense TaxID=438596 RepID=UPI000406FB4A|nr:alkaline phosphatase PafA [Salinimicrobium xinjiangense]
MKYFFQTLLIFLFYSCAAPQEKITNSQGSFNQERNLIATPKLVVGVVVDQMRYDYLTRFWNRYGEDGFKRLVSEGYNLRNNHFNYIPTYTAPGHASVFTGSAPETHGIIGNNWFNKFERQMVYCVEDAGVEPVGTLDDAGKMSPHRLLTTTVSDENRLHTQMRGKTIGVGMKDRGAILPAGHTANAAYWFHGQNEGVWISSSFYFQDLPQWVKDFNAAGHVESYLKPWNTLEDVNTYVESGEDLNIFEGGFRGQETAEFPYDLKELSGQNRGYDIIKETPFGNNLTLDFALAAIDGEQLGQDEFTDFLTLSFSSPDYIGHNFGVNSKEIQDTYMRLDRDIARLLKELDAKVGEGNYTLFLTADHGGVQVPAYLETVKVPSGYFETSNFRNDLDTFISQKFKSDSLIMNVSNGQVFFDYEEIAKNDISREELQMEIAHYLLQYDRINQVYTREQLESSSYGKGLAAAIDNGFHQKRSGDVVYLLDPSVISYSRTGSTHGSGQNYDTHAPLIFFGKGIKAGNSLERTEIIDIAPTISALLGIPFPNGSTGKPLEMVLEK